ncbi:MAG: TonB family protein [Alistipes senegalensis]|nr:TonB family protein [Oxalobacter formigenes]MCM1281356.1 TonB family protein [Alistipes senegalensis]
MSGQGLPVIPRESKTKQSLVLALFVHAALVAFLWVGVSWQTEGGSQAEAEVWDIAVREAAPEAKVPAPEADTETIEDESAHQAEPEPAEPPQVQAKTPPDIALKAEEKRKEEKQKEDAKRQEAQAQQLKQAEARKKEAQAVKEKQLKLADQKKAEAILEQEARRLAARSGTGGSGTAAYSTGSAGADAGYIQKVSARIKSNTLFNVPAGLSGNPPVEYDVELLPDGSIKGMKKRRASGVPGFDEAVRRAIEKSAPFPPNQAGKVPSRFEVSHKPKG